MCEGYCRSSSPPKCRPSPSGTSSTCPPGGRSAIASPALATRVPGKNDCGELDSSLRCTTKKEMESREVSPKTVPYTLADAHSALGDAAGAMKWIEKLDSPQARAEALMGLSIGLSRRDGERPKK